MSDNECKSGWIKLDKGKRKKNEPIMETTEKTTITLNDGVRVVTGEASKEDVDKLAERLSETDSTMAIISQRQEKGMANLNTRVNDLEEQMAIHGGRLSVIDRRIDELEKATKDADARIQSESRRLDMRCNTLLDRVVGTEKVIECIPDQTEQIEILRDKVRSQEAVIAELEEKVGKMEKDVGETFEEAGRMIRDVKDESTQKVEEIAKEMETRLMVRSQEDTDAKLKEATRIQNKDITVMKQKMENVFSRMKRVEEDPSIKAMRLEIEHMGREMKSIMWVAAGALVSALALGIVTILGFAGGF